MTLAGTEKRTLVKPALGGHASIGLLACALIYIISLTGSLIVIHDRWQRWEQPDVAEMTALSPPAAQSAMSSVLAIEKGRPATTHLYIRMPTGDLPRAVVTTDNAAWYVDESGRPVAREGNAWIEFVIGLHEYLHLPSTLGMILVGAIGVALTALVVTGVLAHPRIVRDAFRLRARQHPQIARADWHNRLGVWTLPFVLAVALTGAFIGLGNIGFTVLARAYSGDLTLAYSTVYGSEPKPDARSAPLPNIAAALEGLAARVPQATPTYVIVHDPGTRGQHVQIVATHPRRLIYGETYRFDDRGRWGGPIGMADGALGRQAAASTYNLHFGNFGGLPIEIAYMLFGLALCVVTATGTTLWLDKRRRRGQASPRLQAGWAVVVWGTPLLIVAAFWARVIAGPEAPLAALFWSGLGAALLCATVRPFAWTGNRLRSLFLIASILTGSGHLLITRPAAATLIMLDLLLLVGSLIVLYVTKARQGLRVEGEAVRLAAPSQKPAA